MARMVNGKQKEYYYGIKRNLIFLVDVSKKQVKSSGRYVLASNYMKLFVWDIQSQELIKTIEFQANQYSIFSISEDGKYLYLNITKNIIIKYDLNNLQNEPQQIVVNYPDQFQIQSIKETKNKNLIVDIWIPYHNQIVVIDTQNEKIQKQICNQNQSYFYNTQINSIVFYNDNNQLLISNINQIPSAIPKSIVIFSYYNQHISISMQDKIVVFGRRNQNYVKVLNLTNGKIIRKITLQGKIEQCLLSQNKKLLAVTVNSTPKLIRIFDMTECKIIKFFMKKTYPLNDIMAFSEDSQHIIYGSHQKIMIFKV